MPAKDDPIVIKKYANRRLYNTGTSTYVTLEDQMQMVVPSFLEQSMMAFSKEQERMREQMDKAFGGSSMDMMGMSAPMKMVEEQTRRNIEMFQNAMRMFAPTPPAPNQGAAREDNAGEEAPRSDDLKELREQIADMQRKINSLGGS